VRVRERVRVRVRVGLSEAGMELAHRASPTMALVCGTCSSCSSPRWWSSASTSPNLHEGGFSLSSPLAGG